MARRWDGRRALVTGASSGVGLEIARALAADGAHVILPVRDRARGEAAVRSIRDSVPDAALEVRDLDLADLASVRALVSGLQEPIDLVVLNAGVVLLGDRERHETVDGHELHLQTNFLGHAVLTVGMLPLLRPGARIAAQLSLAARFGRLDDLESRRRYRALRAYAASKRALGLWALEFGRRNAGIRVGLCHPGIAPGTRIAGELRRRLPPGLEAAIVRRFGTAPAEAARPALAALASDAPDGWVFAPGGQGREVRRGEPWRSLRSVVDAKRVWEVAVRAR